MTQSHIAAMAFAGLFGSTLCLGAEPVARSLILPVPREMAVSGTPFILDEQVTIAVPDQPSSEDLFLARMLTDELGDRFGLHLKTERVRSLDGGRYLSSHDPVKFSASAKPTNSRRSRSTGPVPAPVSRNWATYL